MIINRNDWAFFVSLTNSIPFCRLSHMHYVGMSVNGHTQYNYFPAKKDHNFGNGVLLYHHLRKPPYWYVHKRFSYMYGSLETQFPTSRTVDVSTYMQISDDIHFQTNAQTNVFRNNTYTKRRIFPLQAFLGPKATHHQVLSIIGGTP